MTDHLDDLSGNMRVSGGAFTLVWHQPKSAAYDAAELVRWAAKLNVLRWEIEPRMSRELWLNVRVLARAALRIIMAHSRASTRKEAREVLEGLG